MQASDKDISDEEFREIVINRLSMGNVNVVFTKKDGTERNMLCTLLNIPTEHQPKHENPATEFSKEVVRVFDIENQGWRSFRLDSIKSIGNAV